MEEQEHTFIPPLCAEVGYAPSAAVCCECGHEITTGRRAGNKV